MAEKTLNVKIISRHDTEAAWIETDPVLLEGEVAYSTDKNNRYKVGDGTSKWSALAYSKADPMTHTHTKSQISDFPTSLKNPSALTIQFNGTTNKTYDGSSAQTVNITPGGIGAATSGHTHSTASTSAAGFLRQLNGSTANFLRGDGTWATPPNTTYSTMKGATSSAAGATGLVPAPAAGKQTSFLRGDGTWVVPTNTNTTYSLSKSGSTITLTGSDGSKTSVTDSNTTYSLSSFGITATAAELNYIDGVTSNVQAQLNNKAASSHTHNYAGSSSAGGSANSAVKLNTSTAGSATQPVYFSGGKPVACTYTLGKSVPSNAVFTDTNTWIAFKGATTSAAGTAGYVPAPAAGAANRYFRSDGVWAVPPNTNTTYTLTKSGSTITLTGSDGSKTSVADSNTTYSLSSFGITATAAELNYMDGVTSKVQTQLNGKASTGHTHNYAGSSSAGGAATSANKINATQLTNQNLNSYHAGVNFYYAGGGNTCTNKPSGVDNFGMFVFQTAGGWYTQLLYGSDDDIYTRRWVSDSWTSWSKIYTTTNKPTASEIGAATSSHTHKYAGSSSAGGSATSAVKLDTATAGSATRPVYFSGGKPVACTYTLGKSVPSNAVFTDTNTWIAFKGATTEAAGTAGYAPAPAAGAANRYFRSDGTWAVPPNTTYSNMKGATSSAAGGAGLVPAPAAGKQTSFLRGDGTWVVPTNTNTTYTLTKSGSTITLTGSDGKTTSVTDSNTTYSLSSFGITASAAELNKLDGCTATVTELNCVDGVTSNIQTQLNGKAASSHTHNYAGSSSAGGAATSANKLNTNAGSATQPVYFSGGVPVKCTYTLGKSVPSNAVFTDTNTTNTAGSTNTSSKIFLVGATSQASAPVTYSHDTVYVGTDGCIYSSGLRVATEVYQSSEPTAQVVNDIWMQAY